MDESVVTQNGEAIVGSLPYGLVVVDAESQVQGANGAAAELLPQLGDDGVQCRDLFACTAPGGPCESGCLAARAAATGEPLPEIRIDAPKSGAVTAVWVTASPLPAKGQALLHLRAGDARDRRRRSTPHWISGPSIEITSFGRVQVDSPEGPIGGRWLQQRPGQVLKYLICERNRVVHAEEIADALWPGAGVAGPNRVRHFIHGLRDRLEPARAKRVPSSFIVNVRGAYAIDRRNVRIDADDFERACEDGLQAAAERDDERAALRLEHGLTLFGAEFLADEPYAEWAYEERERLNGLAGKALRALIKIQMRRDQLEAAAGGMERLAGLEPFDEEVQRRMLALFLSLGRRTEAARRYAGFRMRMLREFGEEPGFKLADL